MVEKRVFDTLLTTFIRNDSTSSIRIIGLIDNEGIPISFAIKSRKYKIKPNTLGSNIKQLFYPLENYAKNLGFKWPLVQVNIFEDGCMLLINLGVAILGILFDNSGWPLDKNQIRNLLDNLKIQLENATSGIDGLLSTITGGKNQEIIMESISSEKINKISEILTCLTEGNFGPQKNIDSVPVEEIFQLAGTEFDGFMVDEKNFILSMNPNYGPDFVICTKETLDIELSNFSSLKSGKIVCGLSFYLDGNCIVNSRVGNHNNQSIFMFKKYNNWSVGFKTMISSFYHIANYFVVSLTSEEAIKLIEVIVYITNSIKNIEKYYKKYLNDNDIENSLKFMKRAAILSIRNNDYIGAGDIYQQTASINMKNGNFNEAISQYETAVQKHKLGGNYEKSGIDFRNIASILKKKGDNIGSIENLIKSELELQNTTNSKLISDVLKEKNTLIKPYYDKIVSYIDKLRKESIDFNALSEKFELTEFIILNILNQLIKDDVIKGNLDIEKNLYIKFQKSGKKLSKPEIPKTLTSRLSGTKPISIDYSKIKTELIKIDASLNIMEKAFEAINLPFLRFLKYEDLLNQKEYMDHKIKIWENRDTFVDKNNVNIVCPICFKPLELKKHLCECPNGHLAHQDCISIWIKSQDSCPVCDSPLFPYILKTTFMNVQGSTGNDEENISLIIQLQEQVSKLQEKIKHIEEVNIALKESKGDDKEYFDKVIRERELKERIEQELKRKELTIRELKSMIKLFKR